ncbi:hypothetical protein HZH66_001289 [Vespula vulgaris]|uniref:Uncharacterized protein n=1 Tax=Vespula vulgaris TaxID=7454 RepID=A0A834KSZ7_VESVU|nr:hypothetical protein HZH66_001289 [Vespula vulgaris]
MVSSHGAISIPDIARCRWLEIDSRTPHKESSFFAYSQVFGRVRLFKCMFRNRVSVDLNKVSEEKENVGHGIEKPSTKDRSWNDDEVD